MVYSLYICNGYETFDEKLFGGYSTLKGELKRALYC